MNIWTRIKLWAERKERDTWLDKYHSDQRCPKCDTWQANCGGWRYVELDGPAPFHDVCTCGKCGQKTTLFDFGMGYIEVDPITLGRLKPPAAPPVRTPSTSLIPSFGSLMIVLVFITGVAVGDYPARAGEQS